MAERWFIHDTQEGRTVVYYPSGKIKEVQHFEDGQHQGGDTLWYENGRVQFTVNFEKNLKNGDLYKWSPEGELIFNASYRNDTLVEVKGKPVK